MNISMNLETADDTSIYEMTGRGCLSACRKNKYGLAPKAITTLQEEENKCYAKVSLQVDDRTFVEEEQYYINDWYGFFANIGGYMGLLLGSSLLGLYDEGVGLLRCLKQQFKE